mmetsp:Transcript_34275/g.107382  ORF Transcript_34275/g.107382 Transcript_34275/m.107382 type:complete len:446 (+) Transcript_34275:107-1444(+)
MIVYDPSEIFSTLWWMEGSVIPGILFLAAISGMNGIVAVYFKENYNYYITSTTHSLMASTLGFFLILKNCLAFFHFHSAKRTVHDLLDAMRTLAIHVQAYGVARSEDEARDIVNTYTNLSKHLVVMFYSLTLHLRKQNVLPPKSRLPLYLYPWELSKWNEATVRPLACLVMINNDISKLRNKGIYSDQVACMMSKEVKRMTQIFGEMEKLKDSPTIPFAYYQFCNWTTLAYSLTVPAAIGTYDTYYTATSLLSFFVAALFIGLNFIGNLLQNPFGLGPNDIPLEQWGQSLENELYQHFPIFKFRFGAFPLFVEDFTAYPPEDRRALYKDDSSITMFHKPSAWIVTRNKIRAAMRLGNRKLKKFREAKPTREAIVAEIMRDRRKQAFDDMSLLVQQFGEILSCSVLTFNPLRRCGAKGQGGIKQKRNAEVLEGCSRRISFTPSRNF